MAGEGLPHGLGQLFPDGGAGRELDVDLPPGRLVAPAEGGTGARPAYWLSDGPGQDWWVRLRRAHERSGLWPAFAVPSFFDEDRPWVTGEVSPSPAAGGGQLAPARVLEGLWTDWVEDGEGSAELEPFGPRWPGLAPPGEAGRDPGDFADQYVRDNDDGKSRLLLVAAPRGADVLSAVGWGGAANYTEDMSLLSAVLRGWEDRFGARLIEVGFDTIHLSIAAPPASAGHAEQVAAEHFAFCPDNIAQCATPTIGGYAAARVQGKAGWSFWWD